MVAKAFIILACVFLSSHAYSTPVEENKPFDCPPNEKYYKCHLEVCFKTCEHVLQHPPCPLIAANCYLPSCECIDGYVRYKGVCVPEDDCYKAD